MTSNYNAPFGIYIHWPFCASKCPYCDFNSHVREKINHDVWRQAFRAEIERYAAETGHRRVTSIFFGGGTPSLMEPETLADIIENIKNYWPVAQNVEVTMEANPSSAEAKNFETCRSAGVNRLSLGVQSLSDDSLKFLGRRHSALEAIDALETAAQIFKLFSIDLMYGLPGQTLEEWDNELNNALNLCENHISVYQLTIEPGTVFYREKVPEVNEGLSNQLYRRTQEILNLAGLPAYEISNHARPGYECAHNLLYWRGEDYLGLGPGAHGRLTKKSEGGFFETEAIQEFRNPDKWLDSIRTDGEGTQKRYTLAFQERLEELILFGLRVSEGVDVERFYRLTGRRLFDHLKEEKLDMLVKGGFLIGSRSKLRLTESGLRRLNSIARALLV